MSQKNSRSLWWLAAPASAALFAVSLIGFAAARTDGYSHATKAVSELGSTDAPLALAFNLAGFIAPGFLVLGFAIALARHSDRKTGPCLLAGSGILLALAGCAPADMANPQSLTSLLHLLGAVGSGTSWVFALFWLGPLLRREFGLHAWGRITPWFALFLFANIGWQIAFQATGLVLPGWGQRIGFAGYFLWIAVTGMLLWRRSKTSEA